MIDYVKVNKNFKNKKTGDCVVRALSTASGKDYKQVAKELFEIYMKYGYIINDKHCYERWLDENGFIKRPQPRKWDNTKYLIGEIEELIDEDCKVIVSCANHLTCVVDLTLLDIWDCRKKCIGNYYVKK
jgi:hypothetical protein